MGIYPSSPSVSYDGEQLLCVDCALKITFYLLFVNLNKEVKSKREQLAITNVSVSPKRVFQLDDDCGKPDLGHVRVHVSCRPQRVQYSPDKDCFQDLYTFALVRRLYLNGGGKPPQYHDIRTPSIVYVMCCNASLIFCIVRSLINCHLVIRELQATTIIKPRLFIF